LTTVTAKYAGITANNQVTSLQSTVAAANTAVVTVVDIYRKICTIRSFNALLFFTVHISVLHLAATVN
jgi:hypothetical protein